MKDFIRSDLWNYFKLPAWSPMALTLLMFCMLTSAVSSGQTGGIAGDINESGRVDGHDLWVFSLARDTQEGDPDFNPEADLNKDGFVNELDLAILSANFGFTGRGLFLWVSDTNNDEVVKLLLSSGDEKVRIDLCDGPISVSADNKSGAVWVACFNSHQVVKLSRTGEELCRISGFYYPRGVDVKEDTGDAWVADRNHNTVVKLDADVPDGYDISSDTGHHITITGFSYPFDVSVNQSNGFVWVADKNSGRIYSLYPDVPDQYDVGGDSGYHHVKGGFYDPSAVSVNPGDATCWAADSNHDQIVKIAPSGTFELIREGGFNYPRDVSVNPIDGSCWVADSGNDRVVKLDTSGNILFEVPGIDNPYSVCVDPRDGSCWVASYGDNDVIKILVSGMEVIRNEDFNRPHDVEIYYAEPPIGSPQAFSDVYPVRVQIGDEIIFDGWGVDEENELILYEWDFEGDGTYDWSSTENGYTTHSYSQNGVFNPVFRVTNEKYLSDISFSQHVRVGALQAFAEVEPSTGYAPLQVTFSGSFYDPIDGEAESYQWDFDGDGFYDSFQSANQNPKTKNHTYSAYGVYEAVLKVTDTGNVVAIDTVTVEVLKSEPTATASGSPLSGRIPITVSFTGSGSDADGSIVFYQWDFEDDGVFDWFSVSSGNIDHLYTDYGDITARFRVTDNDGQTADDTVELSFNSRRPFAYADADPTQGNAPLSVHFTGSGEDPDGNIILYQWDFDGDGDFDWSGFGDGNTIKVYQAPGEYDAVFKVTDNYYDTGTTSVHISVYPGDYPVPVAEADPEESFINDDVNLIGENSYDPNGTIELYEWDFDVTPALFDDMESDQSDWAAQSPWGRTNEDYHSAENCWTDSPEGNYGNNSNTALTSASFALPENPSGTVLSFWHRYETQSGNDYCYVEISTDGGQNWTTVTDYSGTQVAWIKAELDISAYDDQAEVQIRFRLNTNSSTTYDGWYIDDVKISQEFNADYTSVDQPNTTAAYAEPGTYHAALRVTDDDGNMVTDTAAVEVNAGKPDATAEADPEYGLAPLSVDLIGANSSDPNGTLTLYEWDYEYYFFFDDAENGPHQWRADPPWGIKDYDALSGTHSWSESPSGDYSADMNASLTSHSFSLAGGTTAELSFYYKLAADEEVDFNDTAYVEISTDGGEVWTELASYDYNDNTGDLWVQEAIDISSYSGSTDVILRFRFYSDGTGNDDGWTIDDVMITDGFTPDYTSPDTPDTSNVYENPGYNYAALRVTDDDGQTDVDIVRIHPQSNPVAEIVYPNDGEVLPAGEIVMMGRGHDEDGSIILYEWDFDGGGGYDWSSETTGTVVHEYTQAGLVNAWLRIRDDDNLIDETSVTFTLKKYPPVIESFTADPEEGAAPLAVQFEVAAHDYDGEIIQYEWDFDGDGTYDETTQSGETSYNYETPVTTNVIVRVTDDDDLKDTELTKVVVKPAGYPTASAEVNPPLGYVNQELEFNGTGTDVLPGMIVLYEWDFDGDDAYDWSSADTGMTTHAYTEPGAYEPKLRVTDDDGFQDTDTASVRVDYSGPGDGSVWTVNEGANTVHRYIAGLKEWEASGFSSPHGISVNPGDASVWTADSGNNQVVKLDAGGNEALRLDGFNQPEDTGTYHADGSCWISDAGNGQAILMDENGTELQRIGGFNVPKGIDVDQTDGSVWISDSGNNEIVKLATDGSELARIPGFDQPADVSVNQADGTCWVADTGAGEVVLLSADGSSELLRVSGFDQPDRVEAGADRRVWVCDEARGMIFQVLADGTLVSSVPLTAPSGTAWDAGSMSVWAIDYNDDVLIRLSAAGDPEFQITGLSAPWDVDVLPGFGAEDSPPEATATAIPLTGNAPLNVNFTGSGTDDGSIVAYQWDFNGDGLYDYMSMTDGDTSYVYDSPGIYNPVFRVTDDDGLHGYVTSIIIRVGPVTAWASADPLSGYGDLEVSFDGGGSSPFGDGTIHLYEWDFDSDGIYDWSSTTGAETTHTYSTGVWIPVLRVTDSMNNQATAVTQPIEVSAYPPTADFTVSPTSGSNPLTVSMNGDSESYDPDGTIVLWEWDYDGNGAYDYVSETTSDTSFTYTNIGVFPLTLRVTDNDGLTDTHSQDITVGNSPPVAHALADPQEGNAPLDVIFTGEVEDLENMIDLYEWDFGDSRVFFDDFESGSSQWQLQPTWGFIVGTAYSPTHSLTDSPWGDYYDYTDTSAISVNFNIPEGAAMLRFQHRHLLASGDHGYLYISTNGGSNWHQLADYTGNRASWTLTEIDISGYSGHADTKLRFRFTSNSSATSDGWFIDDVAVTAVTWDYSSTETGDTTHTYSQPGEYTATFRVTDHGGLTDTDTVRITVNSSGAPTAHADANPTWGGVPLIVNFSGTGTDADGEIIRYEWDFENDGVMDYFSTETGDTSHTYLEGGSYEAVLRVTDDDLLSDTDMVEISVGAPVAMPFAYPVSGTVPLTVQFVCNGEDEDGTIEHFYWDYDGNGSNDYHTRVPNARNYTFNSIGVYESRLTVVDNNGLSDSETITITVMPSYSEEPLAEAYADPVEGAPPLEVEFTGYGTDLDGTIELFEWDFDGDGTYDWSSETTGITAHTYENLGDFTATFRITDNDGLTGTDSVLIKVNVSGRPTAIAQADPLSGDSPLTVDFMGEGTDIDGTIELYEWDFDGDGTYDWSSEDSGYTSHTYTDPGNNEAVLRVTDNDGLSDTDRVSILVDMTLFAQRNKESFDPTLDQTVEIQSTLTGTCIVTLRIVNREVQHVRTLVDQELRQPGYYSDVWDGKDDFGQYAPSGAYFFIFDYVIDGTEYHFDLTGSAGSQIFPSVNYSSSYNPLEDDYLTATFHLSAPAEVTTYISPFSGGAQQRIRTINLREPVKSGPKVVVWDGTTDDGTVASFNQSYVMAVLMWALSDNAIIVASDPIVADISVEPNFYNPKNAYQLDPNAPCRFTYSLSKTSDIHVTVRNEDNRLANEFFLSEVDPGANVFYWNGESFNGRLMKDGIYHVGFRAEDQFGNRSDRIHGIMKVFY